MISPSLIQEIARITQLPAQQFEIEIQKHLNEPHLTRIFADLMASNLSTQQKQMAAVGVNQLVRVKMDKNHKQWRNIWREYSEEVLMHPEADHIQWRHLKITGKALEILMDEFQSQLGNIVNAIFSQLPFQAKILLYDAFLVVQTTYPTRYIFLRQTIEEYIDQSLNFICKIHQNPDQKYRLLESNILQNLQLLLKNIQKYQNYDPINQLIFKLCKKDELFDIIVEQLIHSPQKKQCVSLKNQPFTLKRMNELVLVGHCQNKLEEEHINNMKANAVKIFTYALKKYDPKQEMEAFDTEQYLALLENLVPLILEEFSFLTHPKKKQFILQNENIFISYLQLLNRATKFSLLYTFVHENYEKILFNIIFQLLAISQAECQWYQTSPQDFIKQAETLIDQDNQQFQQEQERIKNSCGKFLEAMVIYIEWSLLFTVQICCDSIIFHLDGKINPILEMYQQKYNYLPSIECSFTILSILAFRYVHRPDILELLKNKLLNHEKIQELRGIDKARLLIFLSYNYQLIYQKCPNDGSRLLLLANNSLEENSTISECSLNFFYNCLELGFGIEIWNSLVSKVQNTKYTGILSLLKKIIKEMLEKLPAQPLKLLIDNVIQRLIVQYQICQKSPIEGKIAGNTFLYKCLHILQQISQNGKYLKQEKEVIDSIWPVFDFFEFSDKIEFQDTILTIFNNILKVDRPFSPRLLFPLPFLIQIHKKHESFGILVSTYTLILSKGRQYFFSTGKSELMKLIQIFKEAYGMNPTEENLRYLCIFMHYIYLQYSSLLREDTSFKQKIIDIYFLRREFLKNQTKAALINLFIIGECIFGGYNLQIIRENQINIFKHYQGELFAIGLAKIIEKEYQSENLLQYLQYAVRLLHFVRSTKSTNSNQKLYIRPDFPELQFIDPFIEICNALDFLKQHIPQRRYDTLMEELSKEISLGEVRDLLSKRVVDRHVRTFHKIKLIVP